jgi:hypothetical protein
MFMKKRVIGIVLALLLVAISVPIATALAHETLPLDHVVISPADATVALGGMQQFTASGQDSHNTTLTRVTYTWAVVAGGGTINSTGLFTTGNATGTFVNTVKVTATKNSIETSDNATVTIVVPGPLDHVVISPVTATVQLGGTQQFTASGYDSNNVTLPGVTYTWSVVAGGGTIDSAGLFTTGNATGTFVNTVKVTATKNSIEKTAFTTVNIKANEKEDKDSDRPNGWSHGNKKGWHGEDTPPGWSHGKKTGWHDKSQPNGLSKSKIDRDDD